MTLVRDQERIDDTMYLDRRRAPRQTQQRPVKVYEPAASRFFPGQTRNVSATGLQLEFPLFVQLRPGRLINIHIGVETGGQALANRRSMVPARVVWMNTDTDVDAPKLIVGVEFLNCVRANAA